MLTEIQALVFSSLLAWVMVMASSALRSRLWTPAGMKVAFGNREAVPEPTPLAGRADRAARNMLENLPLLVALLLAARWSGHSSSTSVAMGASVFFWARLVYWPVYLGGLPYVRTLIWAASIVGLAMIGGAALGT
jgi:uncharacterized MAPEG superfamily protein